MKHRFSEHIAAVVGTLAIAGCAGGSSCAGVTPLEAGFKNDQRIENAGSIRLTSSGLGFLEKNLDGLASSVLGLNASGGILIVPIVGGASPSVTVCPGGPDPSASPPRCVTEIDLGSAGLKLEAVTPTTLRLQGALPFRVQDLPIELTPGGPLTLTMNGNGACPPNAQTFAPVQGTLGIAIELNTKTAKLGYSRGRVAEVTIDKQAMRDALHVCGGPGPGFEDAVVDSLHAQVLDAVRYSLEAAVCVNADPTLALPCPKGTHEVDGLCRYGTTSADECVAALLGADGSLDLGASFSSISPGAKSGLDFLFALGGAGPRPDGSKMAFGDLNPIAGGASFGLYGGVMAAPASSCGPLSKLELPTGIPIPDEMLGNTFPDWPGNVAGPHMGIALSERFLNYALGQAHNSGAFCLAISTTAVDLLSSGTVGLVANSIKDLGIQQESQQIAIVLRPSEPPHVEIGGGTSIATDPLLRVTLNQVSFDMYVWSLDRFIRFLTVTLDIDAPVNLTATPDGLQPVLANLGVTNAVVTNSELLREEPAKIAAALQDLVSGLVGQALGQSFAPLNINDLLLSGLGITLTIPDSVTDKGSPGLRKLSKDSDDFLGIFGTAGFSKNKAAPSPGAPGARVEIARKEIDPAGVKLPTMTPANAPVVRIEMGSEEGSAERPVEYSYRVDQGLWRPFTRESAADVSDPWLRLQGRHSIQVRSRFAGDPMSLDAEPSSVEVLIDVDAPAIEIGEGDTESGKVALTVRDFVSDGDRTRVRTRLDEGAWSAWAPASEAASIDVGGAAEITVEARDEEGNIASASQALIRGGAAASAAGCGCVAAGQEPPASPWAALSAAALAAIVIRSPRKRRGA